MKLPVSTFRPLLVGLMACALATPAMAQDRRVGPDQIRSYWILLNQQVDVNVPYSGKNLDQPGCVAVTFTIGSQGTTHDAKVARVVPKSDLGKVALSAVNNFHYGPSLTNRQGDPVATYYIVPFNSPSDKAGQAKAMAPCKLAGYDQA